MYIRIEPSVKIKAEKILNDLGLSITEAVNLFLNQVVLHEGIPFKFEKPGYNKKTINAMEDVQNGINLSKSFDCVDEMFEDLDK